jgi:hypothetical protein
MIGQNKYLKQFKDIKGEVPELGDQVVYPIWSSTKIGYVNGIKLVDISKGERYMKPRIRITDTMNDTWGHELGKEVFQNCIILKKNKQTVPWQFKQ